MSALLAIELSGPQATVALRHAGRTLEHDFTARRGRALVPAVAELLAEAGVERNELRAVLCGTGPGSYTGLRIAAAAAHALGFALGIPAAGVPSLHAAALQAPDGSPVHLLLDAFRGEVYHAELVPHADGVEERSAPRVVARGAVAGLVPQGALLIGDPTLLDGDPAPSDNATRRDATRVRVLCAEVAPRAAALLEVALRRGLGEDGSGVAALEAPEPLYLRPAAFRPQA